MVDSGTAVSNSERVSGNRGYASVPRQAPQAMSQDSGVVVMPQGESAPMTFAAPQSAPIGTGPITPGPATSGPITPQPYNSAPVTSNYSMPATSNAPTGIPSNNASSGGLAADEQLDGPVLALLTTAQQQQGGGDLNGASSSLERAQRIAPREPQVLYRLAQVRLSQGDAPQAEQLARRALTYANGRPDLQASLWNTIAQAREKQGDSAGASQARQKASGG
ncbi:hypothetical protein PMM47T1_28206 [Pseudomonas sp. M47T1]|nr:hypothetical protein PMM47T1_28206 [Pseudomonas sp. M47T1]